MKILKFDKDLVPLVLSGSKTSTWRLFDDKNLSEGDQIELHESGMSKPFAYAEIIKVVEKRFSDIQPEDRVGHEGFESDQQMYKTYSMYYSTNVGPDSKLKIIWFEIYTSS